MEVIVAMRYRCFFFQRFYCRPFRLREFFFYVLFFVLWGCLRNTCVLAQAQSNSVVNNRDASSRISASSVLDSVRPNTRIGGVQYDGSLRPTPGGASRFTNDNVVEYGDTGNVVGINRTSSSRFSVNGESGFVSKNNFNLLLLKKEIEQVRERQKHWNELFGSSNSAPRVIQASRPERYPITRNHSVGYGKPRIEQLDQQDLVSDDKYMRQSLQLPKDNENNKVRSQQIWMRGRTPRVNKIPTDSENIVKKENSRLNVSGLDGYNPNDFNHNSDGSVLSQLGVISDELVGVGNERGMAWTFPPLPKTPAEQYQVFIENLEGELLQSPEVAPLSPVQVDYQDGVATVHGVVPTPKARATAGRILLNNPRIRRVNNQMTFLHNDETDNNGLIPVPSTKSTIK